MIKLLIALELHDALATVKLEDAPFILAVCIGSALLGVVWFLAIHMFDWIYEKRLGLRKVEWLTAISAAIVTLIPILIVVHIWPPPGGF